MNRDLLIGLGVAILLHGGLALGGDFFKSKPAPAPVAEEIPLVELAPLPPLEPEQIEYSEASAESGGDLSDIVPPMQADTPAPTASSFVQQIQPPPPPGLSRPTGAITIPTRPGAGLGTGTGDGFRNLFDLASLDQPPVPRVQIRPNYPLEMSRAGINGEVVVGLVIDSEGNVRNPYIISSTHREFESEALRAISRWKFKPGRKNGVDVSTRNVRLPIVFNMTGN
jgi:periplasmic protein TonB